MSIHNILFWFIERVTTENVLGDAQCKKKNPTFKETKDIIAAQLLFFTETKVT